MKPREYTISFTKRELVELIQRLTVGLLVGRPYFFTDKKAELKYIKSRKQTETILAKLRAFGH